MDHRPLPREVPVRLWETTGMVADPSAAWAALLREGADPAAVPPAWSLGPYRARAFLDAEGQEYRQSLA